MHMYAPEQVPEHYRPAFVQPSNNTDKSASPGNILQMTIEHSELRITFTILSRFCVHL